MGRLTDDELTAKVDSLRNCGGVYEYVAACVQHDNEGEKR